MKRPAMLLLILTMAFPLIAADDPVITAINPPTAPSYGYTLAKIIGTNLNLCAASDCAVPQRIEIDGQQVPFLERTPGGILVPLPSHAQGPVTVNVVNAEGKSASRSDPLTYVYPPSDPNFEAVLFPISRDPFNGEHGSSWVTTNLGWLSGTDDMKLIGPAECRIDSCPDVATLHAQAVTSLVPQHLSYDATDGVVYYVGRARSPDAAFSSRIEDTSRSTLTWGTEIPVVREKDFLTGTAELLDVPTDPRFRQTLRLYEPAGGGNSLVDVRFFDMAGGSLLAEEVLSFGGPGGPYQPSPNYIQVGSLLLRHPPLSTVESLRIELVPLTPGLRYWAMASITNNDTQHVTLVTPR